MKVALPVRVLLLFKTVHTTNDCAPRGRDSLGGGARTPGRHWSDRALSKWDAA